MFSIKSYFNKSKLQTETDDQKPVNANASFTKEYIPPKKDRFSGRSLAFSIDETSIQMAAVNVRSRFYEVIDIRKVYIPSDLLTSPARRDFISQTIEEFLEEYASKKCRITATLTGSETAFRTTVMPSLSAKELALAVEFEARKKIPFPVEGTIYDHRPVYKITSGDTTKFKVALMAATKTAVERNIELLRERDILVDRVYHSPEVVGQFLRYLPNFKDDYAFSLLNIGRNSSEIAFYRGITLEFYHQINTGTSLIKEDNQKGKPLEYLAETLATEIQTSVDYYSGQYQTLSTDKIFLYGDLAYSQELISLLNTSLGFEFVRFPFEQLTLLRGRQPDSLESAAVCLPVLAASTCQIKLANLLPQQDKAIHQRNRYHSLGRLALAIWLIILAAGWVVEGYKIRVEKDLAISLQRQVEDFRNSEIFHQYNMLKSNIAIAQAYLKQAEQNPSYLALNLKELSLLSPAKLRLIQLDFVNDNSQENLKLFGRVTSQKVPPEVILAEYIERLNASPFYDQVELKRHVKQKENDAFTIEFQIGMRGTI